MASTRLAVSRRARLPLSQKSPTLRLKRKERFPYGRSVGRTFRRSRLSTANRLRGSRSRTRRAGQARTATRRASRASLWRQGVGNAAARCELVAACGASDRAPDQPAPAQSERGKHVLATGAPRLGCGSRSVVRLCLGQPPDPHLIRPPWTPRPGRGMALPASLPGRKW
jgi:hypothetical protein